MLLLSMNCLCRLSLAPFLAERLDHLNRVVREGFSSRWPKFLRINICPKFSNAIFVDKGGMS
jgi:hypothetical protein